MIYGIIWVLTVCGVALLNVVIKGPSLLVGMFGAIVGMTVAKGLGEYILRTDGGNKLEKALKRHRLLIVLVTGPVSIVWPFVLVNGGQALTDDLFFIELLLIMVTSAILFSYTKPNNFKEVE